MNAYKKDMLFSVIIGMTMGDAFNSERYLETHKIRLENYANDIDVKMNDF